MKHLTLVILLALAPLSWGEDVYYCVEELSVELAPTVAGDAWELNRYKAEKFTFKYEAGAGRLAFKGRVWGGDELHYLDCQYCQASADMFHAADHNISLKYSDGRFSYAASYFSSVEAKTGTCTKF